MGGVGAFVKTRANGPTERREPQRRGGRGGSRSAGEVRPFGLRGAITAFRPSGGTQGVRIANRSSGRRKAAIPCRTPHRCFTSPGHWHLSDCGERSPLSGRPVKLKACASPTGHPDGKKRQSLAALHTGASHRHRRSPLRFSPLARAILPRFHKRAYGESCPSQIPDPRSQIPDSISNIQHPISNTQYPRSRRRRPSLIALPPAGANARAVP